MKRRIRKLIGLQETFVDLESGNDFAPPEQPPKEPIINQQEVQKEIRNYYGQSVESYHPKVHEVFKMSDSNSKSAATCRAVGSDIGTGFISCAEQEGGEIKFR